MISANLSAIFYLVSGVLFILALRGLSSPETSRQGNFFGIIGMIIAVTVTFLSVGNFTIGFIYVLIFLAIGGTLEFSRRHLILYITPHVRLNLFKLVDTQLVLSSIINQD